MNNKRKILESARKLAQKGSRDKALKQYEKLLKLDPRDAKLRLEIGDAHRRWGQLQEAIRAYTKVAEQYMNEGFDARAVAVFKQIQNLDPERWASYAPLAELYQRMGLNSEAIQSLQTAADGLNTEGKKHDALELLRRMASLDPSNTTSRIKVADLLHQENLNEEAIAEYEGAHAELERQGSGEAAATVLKRILEIEPERSSALVLMGRNFLNRDLAEQAEPFAKRAVEVAPDEPAHFELLADVYRARGCDDELADTYRFLADLYHRRGDEDRAREIIQRFVPPEHIGSGRDMEEVVPTLAETGIGSGPPLLGADSPDAAWGSEELELSEPAAPRNDAEVTLSDAVAAPLAGAGIPLEMPAPARELDDELADEPEDEADPDRQLAEASVYLRYGKRSEALRNLNAVLARDPNHREALAKLGEAHADAGDSDAAVGAWLRAGELAQEASDGQALERLRDCVAALDPAAASALGVDSPIDDNGVEEIFDVSEPGGPEVAVDVADGFNGPEGAEDELELEIADAPVAGFESDQNPPLPAACEEQFVAEPQEDLAAACEEQFVAEPQEDLAAACEEQFVAEPEEDLTAACEEQFVAEPEEGLAAELPEPVTDRSEAVISSLAEAAASSSVTLGVGASTSAATTKRIREDIEEAEFYLMQGLGEEAEAVYRRVLEVAPNHPLALVRMGEISTASRKGPDEPATFAPAEETGRDAARHAEADSTDAPPDGDLGVGEPDPSGPLADESLRELDRTELATDGTSDVATADSLDLSAEDAADSLDLSTDDAGDSFDLAADAAGDSFDLAADAAGDSFDLAADAAGDSFDLAAELSDDLDEANDSSRSASLSGKVGLADDGDAFSAVFAEFKKGVSQTLDAADHEAHYDLGIAYREMGLLEDAIVEFNTASQCPERRVACLHMLGLCALDLGRAGEAVEQLEGALGSGEVEGERAMALRFDLGCALEAAGWLEEARASWQQVAAIDPTFCDVETRLAAFGEEKPDEGDDQMESFDDLIAEVNAVSEAGAESEAACAEPTAIGVPDEPELPPAPKKRRKKKISFV
ncbi:MAG TPA: tetratricopeptide repeat protein [Myxococcota bacterium]|nr:tetratricopeptide repeat protein [Myxococcota bacterium]